MIKCIATDMDGTLLNSTAKKITDENRDAILKAQSQGIEVVIATGRSYDEVDSLLEEAGLQCPVICVNGAELRSKEGEIVSATPLAKQDAADAAMLLKENGVYFEVYTDKGKFTNDPKKSVSIIVDIAVSANPDASYEEMIHFAEERVKTIHQVNDYQELFANEDYQIYKFLAFSFDAEKLAKVSKELGNIEALAVSSSGHENLEITNQQAQKGIALEAFVKAKGISLSETMAIGDNFNDVSMFKKAGRSVAMGNASQMIKDLCDFVTDTNEESGVAKAILTVLE
ncbi:Cof-type HAD-IIB family hydrolase [Bacillota bacterium Lsc_1132]